MKKITNILNRRWLLISVLLSLIAIGGFWLWLPPFHRDLLDFKAATVIRDRDGTVLRVVRNENDTLCEPISLKECGNWIVPALLAAEDKRFFQHTGVDALAVLRAAFYNFTSGRVVSGASTLSMLVCKLTEPRPRTLTTKIIEACHAHKLEITLGKDEILEQFLNRAPFGGNLIGIETAAQRYFGKSAFDLNLPESALLVGLPQSPSRLRPDRHPAQARKRRDYILSRMQACGYITTAEQARATSADPMADWHPFPFRAPHFCDYILSHCNGTNDIHTTLDSAKQQIAETALRARISDLRSFDIQSGAVIILSVASGEILAMVGAPAYFDQSHAGMVNAATARRSPGSALKPFIYALALDMGLCSPGSLLDDTPTNFDSFQPENFDRNFHGRVTTREALVQSLNIPALLLTQAVGLDETVRGLRELGISTLHKNARHYGLSIAMGTCEVTLLELANAYACLARLGEYRPTICRPTTETMPTRQIFSREAAWLIADILSGDERATDADGHMAEIHGPRMAWKTGTSSGNRDAWCLAYNPEYVVGVWLGNPGGQGTESLVGSSAAVPLARSIFRQLYSDGNAPWYHRPSALQQRKICVASGQPASAHCQVCANEDYIPGVTRWQRCPLHSASDTAKIQNNDSVRAGSSQSNRMTKTIATVTDQPAVTGINILSPAPNSTFRLLDDSPLLKQELFLRAVADHADSPLYWFIDGQFYQQANVSETPVWPLTRGHHQITCYTARGQSAKVEIIVE